jgi:hypothetical protein
LSSHVFIIGKAEAVKIEKPKKRVKKDKDAPKKPMSPFFCYQAERRQKLKGEQPDLNNPQIIKVSTFSTSPTQATSCLPP